MFHIYFDVINKQEIIKYRKLQREFVVDSDDSEILEYFNIDEEKNPYHIIDKNDFLDNYFFKFICEKIFIDYNYDFEVKTQTIGSLLLDFINLDLNDVLYFQDFVFKYGIDFILTMDKSKIIKPYVTYSISEFNLLFYKLHNLIKSDLLTIQNEFKKELDFCFSSQVDKSISLLTPMQRYYISYHSCNENAFFTYVPKLKKYSKGITIDFESFFNTNITLEQYSQNNLIKMVLDKSFSLSPYSYICSKLENALFISFTNLISNDKLYIKNCKNCGKYFIPVSRSDEKFCTNLISRDSDKTCRDVGAFNLYNKKIRDNEIESLFRNTSAALAMKVKRNPDIPIYKEKYEKWKIYSKIQKKKYYDKLITKDELIEWINKQRR